MPESRQLDLLKALTAHLEGITPANGYAPLDLAGRVFRGRAVFGDQDRPPMLSILEAPRQDDGRPAGESALKRLEDWVLLLQGWAEDDRANPLDPVYALKAAVEHRLARLAATRAGVPLFPGEHNLGGRASGLVIAPGACRPADQVSPRAYFFLPLVVRVVVDVERPYAAAG